MFIPFFRPKSEKNINKIKKMNATQISKYLGDNVYLIFRYSLTKEAFIDELEKWLNTYDDSKCPL